MADTVIDDTIEKIQTVVSRFPELSTVVLFGSLAGGRAHVDSDVDIAVEGESPLSESTRVSLIEALALALGRPVDLVDLSVVGAPLFHQIISKGIRIRGSNADWARLIYRNVLENEDFVPLQQRILETRQRSWINS